MTGTGTVERIHVARQQGSHPQQVESVRAVAGRGLEGDRYFTDEGRFDHQPGSDITLIEQETLAAVERDYEVTLEPGVHRRNVTTSTIALDHLIDDRFRIGEAVCEGVHLCEPCQYLERYLEASGVREALVHRGGLRATIVETGEIGVGDEVTRV